MNETKKIVSESSLKFGVLRRKTGFYNSQKKVVSWGVSKNQDLVFSRVFVDYRTCLLFVRTNNLIYVN